VHNHLHPRGYIVAIDRGVDGVGNIELLSPAMERGETMMIGLRLLLDGVDAGHFAERHGALLDSVFGDELQSLIEIGMITREGDRIRLTHRGLMVANDVAERFITLA
jgi:oxygen-independent coproporphyrinogen-3 oxidase